ncbi:MAG: DNA translocase FtsK 4TM domain-containing protein [Bacteroidales bacterium]|nr:DNA translocase FtsK 4TM domain-containing protein [Bacteroidales bacterium]
MFNGFGLGSFFFPLVIGAFGLALLRVKYFRLWKNVLRFLLAAVLVSVILGYFAGQSTFLGAGPGGKFGYMIANYLNDGLGKVGTGALLLVVAIAYLIFACKPPDFQAAYRHGCKGRPQCLTPMGGKKDVVTDKVTLPPKRAARLLNRNPSGQ